jgi:hypothetical protein
MRVRDPVITAQSILSLVAIAVMLGYAGHALQLVPQPTVAAYAQDRTPDQPAAPAGQIGQQAGPNASKTAVYSGTILKHGPGFLLRAPSGMEYRLDDPSKAQRFAGMPVKVTGKLNQAVKLIHVEKIEEIRA